MKKMPFIEKTGRVEYEEDGETLAVDGVAV